MTRWCARLADKRFLSFALLTGIAVLLTLQAPKIFSKSPPSKGLLAALPLPPAPSDTGYTMQDGKVVSDGNYTPLDESAVVEPGDINVIDVDKANAMAMAQQKKGAFGKGGGAQVYKKTIDPHWYANNTRFWYRNKLRADTSEFIVVNVEQKTRGPAFDHNKLAAGLSKAAEGKYEGNKLPFETIEFVDVSKAVRFKVGDKFWQCDLTTYDCVPSKTGPPDVIEEEFPPVDEPRDFSQNSYDPLPPEELSPEEIAEIQDQKKKDEQKKDAQKKDGKKGAGAGKGGGPPAAAKDAKSPDGNWQAYIKDRNVWVKDKEGREMQMTKNGVEGNYFSAVAWSPDSKVVIAYRLVPGELTTVYLFETSPKDQLPARMSQRTYPRPADKFPTTEMFLIRVDDLNIKPIKVEIEPNNHSPNPSYPRLRWNKDNTHFTYEKTDRGHQRFRIVEVDARTGKTRALLDEQADSMINHYGAGGGSATFYLQYLDDTNEIVYLSEMDGWKHLYLIDAKAGKIKNQITKGEWIVRSINKLDTKNRQVWFTAGGIYPDQDPYLIHFCRINFDGTGLVIMTAGNGTHSIQYSPDSKYLVATYSRVDMAPVHELRSVATGEKVCDLEKADTSDLEATGWKAPEVFVAKGRDGKTDIWGYVIRPRNFDPSKKYPVIEQIYAGPHSSHVRKTFSETDGLQNMANMGYILVKIEGMGTMNRSRAFHAVAWKNLSDAGFPDRILWMKALAQKYSYIDITRVGIYGTSAGGQNACGALLFHPEFYKVAVAACGCHDNRLDKSSWNEAWMGLFGPHYEANSNITNAHKLQGRLLLIVGELDTNVPPESTYRVVDALIKAGKDFNFIAVPGGGHSNGGPHGTRQQNDFFMQHLQGVAPPNHNLPGAAKKGKGGEE